jgi:hypothetical protein
MDSIWHNYIILLLYYYWLLVSASLDHNQGNIYKKLKSAGAFCKYWPETSSYFKVGKGRVHPCTGTEALYRPCGP